MLVALNDDVLMEICAQVGFFGTIALLQTCVELNSLIDNGAFFGFLAQSLFSKNFWSRAKTESVQPPCKTWKAELERIERFQRVLDSKGERRWTEDVFFKFWEAERSARIRIRKKSAVL